MYVWKASYHGVTHDEDGEIGVAGLHQVDVLQGVSDVNLEVFDVHPVSFTLTVANYGGDQEKERWEESLLLQKAFQFTLVIITAITGT